MAVPSAPVFTSEPASVIFDRPATFAVNVRQSDAVLTVNGSIKDAATQATVSTVAFARDSAYRYTATFTPSAKNLGVGDSFYLSAYAVNSDGAGAAASSSVLTVRSRPSVNVLIPVGGAVLNSLPVTVEWEYLNGWPTAVWVDAVVGGSIVKTLYPDPSDMSATFDQLDVADGDTATFTVFAQFNTGEGFYSSSSSTTVTFDFPNVPGPPTADISYGDGFSASITVHYGTDTDTAAVVRFIDGGEDQWTVAENVADGETVTDLLPPLGVDYSYAVISYSQDGVPLYTQFPARIDTTCWALNYGPAAAMHIAQRFNPSSSRTASRAGAAYHFADRGMGGGLPVWYGLAQRDEGGTLSWDVVGHDAALETLVLGRNWELAWIRNPWGERVYAHVEPSISYDLGELRHVALKWSAMRWREAWDG